MPDWEPQVWVGLVGAAFALIGAILTAVIIYLKLKWDRPTFELFAGSISSRFDEEALVRYGSTSDASRPHGNSGDLMVEMRPEAFEEVDAEEALGALLGHVGAETNENLEDLSLKATKDEDPAAFTAEITSSERPESLEMDVREGRTPGALIVELTCDIQPRNMSRIKVVEGGVVMHPATSHLGPEEFSLSDLGHLSGDVRFPMSVLAVQPESINLTLPIDPRLAGSIEVRMWTRSGEEASTTKKEIPLGNVPDDVLEEEGIKNDGWWPPWT